MTSLWSLVAGRFSRRYPYLLAVVTTLPDDPLASEYQEVLQPDIRETGYHAGASYFSERLCVPAVVDASKPVQYAHLPLVHLGEIIVVGLDNREVGGRRRDLSALSLMKHVKYFTTLEAAVRCSTDTLSKSESRQ